jgi:hypothetical protein
MMIDFDKIYKGLKSMNQLVLGFGPGGLSLCILCGYHMCICPSLSVSVIK